jgi:hypothetical protein
MDVNALGAINSYVYQGALSQSGNADQALAQALAAGQSLTADKSSGGPAKVGPVDPLEAARGDKAQQPASASTSIPTWNAQGPQALAGTLFGSSSSALLSASDSLPASAASLAPGNTEALVRYAYDQSRNPDAAASSAQSTLGTGLNLLA